MAADRDVVGMPAVLRSYTPDWHALGSASGVDAPGSGEAAIGGWTDGTD